ncbi:hypothetical protein LCGC14_1297100 [marine sediment metagenome]|uniref:Uncharacterized protein n=1 Tax=marine sediment metagenome TaxID=412755 RepID=A0A0F9NTK3_9ZZZZ
MRTIQFIPGAIATPNAITIPTGAPSIDVVVSSEIERLPTALGVGDHTAANVALSFGNHTQAQVIVCFDNHTQAQVIAGFADHAMADVALGVGNHTQAQVVATILDHPDLAHDLLVAIAAVGEAFGASGAGATDLSSATGQTIPGDSAAGGVQNNAAQAHVGSTTDLAHVAGANVDHAVGVAVVHGGGGGDLAHVVGAALAHGAAADPVVAAVPTRLSATTLSLNVNTVLGDLLVLTYQEVGEVVRAS